MNSSVRTCLLDPVADPRWAELVETSPDARVFHHPLWLALLRDCYRYRMEAVCVAGRDSKLAAGLPIATITSRFTGRRLVSVPFSDVCGPLERTRGQQTKQLIAAVDAERRRRSLKLEIHCEVPTLPEGVPSDRFYHHVVSLERRDGVLDKGVKQSKRRGASLARERGVTAARAIDRDALDAFFRLHVLTRHRLGLPTQPRRFFRGLAELFDRGLGFVLLARWNQQVIAAAIYLRHRNTLTYKYGASDPGHLDKRPNDLLQLEALRFAQESSCSTLDLGRTELDNDGLRRFKRQLGAEERELTYTMAPRPDHAKSVRSVSNLHRAVIRRAPPTFGKLLGTAVYRHFG